MKAITTRLLPVCLSMQAFFGAIANPIPLPSQTRIAGALAVYCLAAGLGTAHVAGSGGAGSGVAGTVESHPVYVARSCHRARVENARLFALWAESRAYGSAKALVPDCVLAFCAVPAAAAAGGVVAVNVAHAVAVGAEKGRVGKRDTKPPL